MNEIMELTGWSIKRASTTLHQLKAEGRLELLRVRRESLDGRQMPVPAYRLK